MPSNPYYFGTETKFLVLIVVIWVTQWDNTPHTHTCTHTYTHTHTHTRAHTRAHTHTHIHTHTHTNTHTHAHTVCFPSSCSETRPIVTVACLFRLGADPLLKNTFNLSITDMLALKYYPKELHSKAGGER